MGWFNGSIEITRKDHEDTWICSKCDGVNRWVNNTCQHYNTGYSSSHDERTCICAKCQSVNRWANNNCHSCGKGYSSTDD